MRHGSEIDPDNRFERVRRVADLEQVRWDREYLEARQRRPIEYIDDDSRGIVSENDSPDIPFRYSLNPYRGCAHGCAYCYARPTHDQERVGREGSRSVGGIGIPRPCARVRIDHHARRGTGEGSGTADEHPGGPAAGHRRPGRRRGSGGRDGRSDHSRAERLRDPVAIPAVSPAIPAGRPVAAIRLRPVPPTTVGDGTAVAVLTEAEPRNLWIGIGVFRFPMVGAGDDGAPPTVRCPRAPALNATARAVRPVAPPRLVASPLRRTRALTGWQPHTAFRVRSLLGIQCPHRIDHEKRRVKRWIGYNELMRIRTSLSEHPVGFSPNISDTFTLFSVFSTGAQ